MKRRIISFLLAVVMVCALLPTMTVSTEATSITVPEQLNSADYTKIYAAKLEKIFKGKARDGKPGPYDMSLRGVLSTTWQSPT